MQHAEHQVIRAHVLEEPRFAAGLEHPPDLSRHPASVEYRTQHQRRHRRVATRIPDEKGDRMAATTCAGTLAGAAAASGIVSNASAGSTATTSGNHVGQRSDTDLSGYGETSAAGPLSCTDPSAAFCFFPRLAGPVRVPGARHHRQGRGAPELNAVQPGQPRRLPTALRYSSGKPQWTRIPVRDHRRHDWLFS